MDFLIKIFFYIAPLYIANAGAMILGGKTAIDFGTKFLDNNELFGKGKTWKGTIFGTIAGTIIALALATAFPVQTKSFFLDYLLLGFLLSLGAVLGDIAGSFLKRRFSIARGKPVLLLDQLDFVAGGMLLGALVFVPRLEEIVFIVILTLVVHKLSNYLAFKLKIKKVPW